MNEKIKSLIEELQQECSKGEGKGIVVSIVDLLEEEATVSFGGSKAEIGIALLGATDRYTRMMKENPCQCELCQEIRAIMEIEIGQHTEIDEATFKAFMNGGDSNE